MGKTTLARVVLHRSDIVLRYAQQRFFVACDTVSTSVQLAALIGAHIGLNPGKDLTRPVVQFFSNHSPSLLVLDNVETVWEPTESRSDVEKLLSLLADVPHLALIVSAHQIHYSTVTHCPRSPCEVPKGRPVCAGHAHSSSH
jgi:hypothetical protein